VPVFIGKCMARTQLWWHETFRTELLKWTLLAGAQLLGPNAAIETHLGLSRMQTNYSERVLGRKTIGSHLSMHPMSHGALLNFQKKIDFFPWISYFVSYAYIILSENITTYICPAHKKKTMCEFIAHNTITLLCNPPLSAGHIFMKLCRRPTYIQHSLRL
jgi:hypothetical protein